MPEEMLPYLLAMALLGIGVYAIACKKNLIKIIIGVIVMGHAVNLFLVLQGYRARGIAPIQAAPGPDTEIAEATAAFAGVAVDPIPQALVLTSIVIGLGIVALMVAMAIRLYEKYGTFDISEIRKLRG